MAAAPVRNRSSQEWVESFVDETLVVCPRCARCARAAAVDLATKPLIFDPRKVTCSHCGYIDHWEDWSLDRRHGEPPVDDYFHLPLWLQAPCCGHTLWAYNLRHLEVIEQYVAATLRERRRDPKYGWSNHAMISRLPRWIKAEGNREEILRCVDTLKKKG